MSPERIGGGKYGYKSDIWSLGLVLLECATGYFPYSPSEQEGWTSFYELVEAIVDQAPPCSPSFQNFETIEKKKEMLEQIAMAKEQLQELSALDVAKTQWYHFTMIVIAGMGFFTDAYDLFLVANITMLIM